MVWICQDISPVCTIACSLRFIITSYHFSYSRNHIDPWLFYYGFSGSKDFIVVAEQMLDLGL